MTGILDCLARVDDRGRRGGVDRVEHHDLGAVGDRGLSLLLLLGGVLIGVGVDDLAVRADRVELLGEVRTVL